MSARTYQPNLFSWNAPPVNGSSVTAPSKAVVDVPEDDDGWLFADGSIPTDLWGLHLQLYESIERFLAENPDLPLKMGWWDGLAGTRSAIPDALVTATVWAFDRAYGTEGGDHTTPLRRAWVQQPDLTVQAGQVSECLRWYWSDGEKSNRFHEEILTANKQCGGRASQ